MATSQSIATLLRALQSTSNEQDTSRLLTSATTLLTLLTNPSNVTLLTNQILSALGIWNPSIRLETLAQIITVYSSASTNLLNRQDASHPSRRFQNPRSLGLEDWIAAILKGAHREIPSARQVLVIAGLLRGCQSHGRHNQIGHIRTTLQEALVNAVNVSLRDQSPKNSTADLGVLIALSQVFDFLERKHKVILDHDSLLPMLGWAIFLSAHGFNYGYFLSAVDSDILEGPEKKFTWSTSSHSYHQIRSIAASQIFTALGSLSQLMAFSTGCASATIRVSRMLQDLVEFTRSLSIQWRQNKLSEVDGSEEVDFLTEEALKTPLPLLWRVLRSALYTIINVLTAYTRRLLAEHLQSKDDAPFYATQVLRIFRNLSFISSRLGTATLSQYSFVYFATIDIISQYPMHAEAYLRDIKPAELGKIPQHPLDRCMDIFFLNTAEHFTPVLDSNAANDLLIVAASPYLRVDGDRRLLEAFEAAHSIMLAIFAAPHNLELTAAQLEPYALVLFECFPRTLSPRQFRLATKQLIQFASSPSPLQEQRLHLASTLMELLYCHFHAALSRPTPSTLCIDAFGDHVQPMSEQGVLLLALIDSLAFLQIGVLAEWLPVAAQSIQLIHDPVLRHACKQRFWDVLSDGEMDVERAASCVTWWSTGGGRRMVLYGKEKPRGESLMNGASNNSSKL